MSSPNIMPNPTLSSFNKAIDDIRNILRKEGITGMDSMKHCTLYILARALEIKECKRLNISEAFAWEKFMELAKSDSKRQECYNLLYDKNGGNDLISYLDKIFGTRNFNFKLNNPDNHIQILKILNSIHLKELEGHIDILGTVYENHLGSGSNKSAMRDLGQYFTDRKVCTYMTKLCDPKVFSDHKAESVLDPTMGTGGFLTAYVKYLQDKGANIEWSKMQNDIVGCDIDDFVMSIGRINMYLSTGVVFDRISHRDSLHHDVGESTQRLKFKNILANMPFGVKGLKFADCCPRVKEQKCDGTKSEPLFLNLMMSALDEGGRCAVVVPDGVLVNNSNQHINTRKYLLNNFELKRVIKMKGQFFSNTGIQPSILFFENTGKKTQSVEFWEVEQNSTGEIIEVLSLRFPSEKLDNSFSLDMRRYEEVEKNINANVYPSVKLSEIIEFKNGKNIPERDRVEKGSYPYYASNGIKGYVDEWLFEGPAALLGDQGSLWKCHFVEEGHKFYAGNHTVVMKVKNNLLDIKYIYYYIQLNDFNSFNRASTLIPEMDKERFYDYKISLPPLSIQKEIIAALDHIYKNANIAKATAESVKAQMAAVVRSVNARGYEQKKLSEACNISKGKRNLNGKDTGYPYQDVAHVSRLVENYILDGPAVLTPRAMSVGRFVYTDEKCHPSDDMFILKANDYLLPRYLFHYCNLLLVNEIRKSIHGVKPTIDYSAFDVNYIVVPPLAVQQEVLTILNEMEAERATLEQMAAKAEQRAKYILDGYLTPAPQEPVVEAPPAPTTESKKSKKKRAEIVYED